MDRTARALLARAQPDPDAVTFRVGTVVGTAANGALNVDLGGTVIQVAADRSRPNPGRGPVVLLYARGAYFAAAFPAPPTS